MDEIKSSFGGYSLVELVLVVLLMAIMATYTVSNLTNSSEAVRFEATRAKMEAIRAAIIGNDTTSAEGRRINFGYHGDMGKLPTTLTDLTLIGTQPAWAYSTADGFGYGWRGPYLTTAATGAKVITQDEWGQSFVYTTGANPPSLTSYAADASAAGSGYGKDLVVEFPTSVRLATVSGIVADKDNRLASKTVKLYYPSVGALTSATATSDSNGVFSFSSIPLGVRSVAVTSSPTLGPKTVVVDKAQTDISSSVLNYYGATEAISLVASSSTLTGGTASTNGFNNQVLMGQLSSTYRAEMQIAFVTITAANSANVVSYSLNGVPNVFSAPVASGSRQAISVRQIFPALSGVNTLQINFDTNIKNSSVTILFEYYNSSRTDTVTLSADPTWGASGTLDLSLNTVGDLVSSIGTSHQQAYSLLIQTDAKVVAVGQMNVGTKSNVALIRYTIGGSVDTTFQTSGKVSTSIGTANDQAYCSTLQTDGKLVAAGSTTNTTTDCALVRYLTNGTLDTAFNRSGINTTTLVSGANDELYGLTMQTDGRLVATGIVSLAVVNVAVVRYLTDGTLDTTFNTTGKSFTTIGGSSNSYGRAIVMQTDGKLVVSGYTYTTASGNYDYLMMRYNSNGALDTSFKTSGLTVTTIGAADDFGRALALQTDGKIVQAGYYTATNEDFALVRYNTNGSIDTTFNTFGKSLTSVSGNHDEAYSLAIQANGKMVAAGTADLNGSAAWNFAFIRFNASGTIDTSFNTSGRLTVSINTANVLYGITLDTNGRIVGAGKDTKSGNLQFGVIRVWP